MGDLYCFLSVGVEIRCVGSNIAHHPWRAPKEGERARRNGSCQNISEPEPTSVMERPQRGLHPADPSDARTNHQGSRAAWCRPLGPAMRSPSAGGVATDNQSGTHPPRRRLAPPPPSNRVTPSDAPDPPPLPSDREVAGAVSPCIIIAPVTPVAVGFTFAPNHTKE
ncbi:hypothetical protein BHE74_00019550 [Ensete ventricosum]|nr:hypothetical protein BHE74_00019550 [Ensete ventricosum]